MGKTNTISKVAQRIQSHVDRTAKNYGFKARTQNAAKIGKSKK